MLSEDRFSWMSPDALLRARENYVIQKGGRNSGSYGQFCHQLFIFPGSTLLIGILWKDKICFYTHRHTHLPGGLPWSLSSQPRQPPLPLDDMVNRAPFIVRKGERESARVHYRQSRSESVHLWRRREVEMVAGTGQADVDEFSCLFWAHTCKSCEQVWIEQTTTWSNYIKTSALFSSVENNDIKRIKLPKHQPLYRTPANHILWTQHRGQSCRTITLQCKPPNPLVFLEASAQHVSCHPQTLWAPWAHFLLWVLFNVWIRTPLLWGLSLLDLGLSLASVWWIRVI